MMSHEKAMAVNIVDKKDLSPDAGSEMDAELSRFMIQACIARQQIFETICKNSLLLHLLDRQRLPRLIANWLDYKERSLKRGKSWNKHAVQLLQQWSDWTQLKESKGLSSELSTRLLELDESERSWFLDMHGETSAV
jgi:hypothetical protein